MHACENTEKGVTFTPEDLYKQMVTLRNTQAGADPEASVQVGGEHERGTCECVHVCMCAGTQTPAEAPSVRGEEEKVTERD